ncbi:MAG: glycosyltransferase family 2 protein [Anaerolineales bacterium]|jgi:cellulose synthase/poly-beta-1,6-N-acetylglucosamine synthase-like glycosyltransferase
MIGLLLFWGALILLSYTYVIYPAIIFLRGLLLRKPYKKASITPYVSVIIAAYNEANNIGARLDNLLSLDYPRDLLEVIVASDGSSDGTDAIVGSYSERGVRLLALPRQGKYAALNAAAEASTGEILVFSDANSIYALDAIRELVRPFADPIVGGVAGDQRYLKSASSDSSGEGERSYWSFDRTLKKSQSRSGNVISATGAIYAIRRGLFQPIPAGAVDDFITSTRVIAQGYRLVFADKAFAYEHVAASPRLEFGRKVRVINQGLNAVLAMRELLNPFRYHFYAIQLFSHKVLRRMMFIPLMVLFLVSPFLWREGFLYQAAAVGQVGFYGLALLGLIMDGKTRLGDLKLFSIPFFFCMVYAASLIATLQVLRGEKIRGWETRRLDSSQEEVVERVANFRPVKEESS